MKTTKRTARRRHYVTQNDDWSCVSEAGSLFFGLLVFGTPLLVISAWVPVLMPVCAVIGFLMFMIEASA